ncbi:MAG: response regulator [Pseudomonadota bacterium]
MRNTDILMIDDNRILRKVVQRYLTRRGLGIITVATAAAAQRVLARHSPRLLLVDMQLPDASGLTLVRNFAARGITVIAITADSSPRCEHELHHAGAAACLIKPFPLPVLAQAISHALAD